MTAYSVEVSDVAGEDYDSVLALMRQLVRIPSRGGLDPYDGIITHVTKWLGANGLPCRRLEDRETGRTVALSCDVVGEQPGPHYVLDACLDTAPFGDAKAWRFPPTSAAIEDGWLYGRGAADSKAAIAIFMHLAVRLRERVRELRGTLTLLFDADEHTGYFGGAKRYFEDADEPRHISGVMIGYPGIEELVIGGRGFLRAEITVHGEAGHTGSSRAAKNVNAIEKAAELVRVLTEHRIPGAVDEVLGLPPKVTVTGITGGESYSIIPDRCLVNVDARLTTIFDENAAREMLSDAVSEIDTGTSIACEESWPAYRLDDNAAIRRALTQAARNQLGHPVTEKVAGPSNIGNYLNKLGINTTAGFGVRYENLHGTDERIELRTIPLVQAVYHEAVLTLLTTEAGADAAKR
jgi:succinyl-diaminopimelate desuccinylase